MIASTYIGSGVLLAITAFLFNAGALTAVTQTIAWCAIFYFASAGASSAYLTVSEIFPMEVRAKAIAVFFALAQCFGAFGPVFYGWLIGDGSDPSRLFVGYLIGAAVMVIGGSCSASPRSGSRWRTSRRRSRRLVGVVPVLPVRRVGVRPARSDPHPAPDGTPASVGVPFCACPLLRGEPSGTRFCGPPAACRASGGAFAAGDL
jgi:MFS family permease